MSLRPNARTEVRRNRYKVAVDADEGRRRREDNMVEIRKNKREENLQKKRREGLQALQFQPTVNVPQLDKKVVPITWIQLYCFFCFRLLIDYRRVLCLVFDPVLLD